MSSNSTTPLLPLLLACSLFYSGCVRADDRPKMKVVKEARHANGLTVGLPEGFGARQTEDGFVVEPSGDRNRQLRDPVVAYVSLFKGIGSQDDYGLRAKSVGGREVLYRVTRSENPGSGGDIYALEVSEGVPGGHVEYTQATQSEAGEPDFALCWALVGSTKYRESR